MNVCVCVFVFLKVLVYIKDGWKYNLKLTRGVSHYGLDICIKKYLKAKEKLKKLKRFTMQKYNPQKILYKKPYSFNIL
jgi:hypothetical protein